MYKINILIIAYKQESLIKRALDSILCQKNYGLNRIIVSDDSSPDKTWEVLRSYREKYPAIIEIYRNQSNLGIYGNKNRIMQLKGDADIYYSMAGDDALCEGILEQVQNTVDKNKIDCNESAAIYFDWKSVNPNGKERIVKNNCILKTKDTLGLKLRNRISGRSCFVTKGLIKQYPVINLDYGLSLAESMADLQYSLLARKNYYSSYVGSVYYSGIGVSTSLFTKAYYKSSIEAIKQLKQILPLSKRDVYWLNYRMYYNIMGVSPSISSFFKMIFYYALGTRYGTMRRYLIDLLGIFQITKMSFCKLSIK